VEGAIMVYLIFFLQDNMTAFEEEAIGSSPLKRK
jgi:hypothetical protein